MNHTQLLNISMETICICVLVILLISALLSDERKERQSRMFILFCLFGMLSIASDMGTWIFYGSEAPYALVLLHISSIGVWIFACLSAFFVDLFILTYIRGKHSFSMKLVYAYIAGWSIALLFIIVLLITGTLYFIDENNHYTLGSLGITAMLPFMLSVLIGPIIILKYAKFIGFNDTLIFLLCKAASIIAAIIIFSNMGSQLQAHQASLTISILLIYIRIQVENEKKAKQQELDLAEARVNIMLSQIQPHFLYNTLATIEAFCYEDGETAAKMVNDFSSYLRENMDSLTQKELVSFDRELAHIKIYLDIEKRRFAEQLNIVYNLEVTDFRLPILTIQPLVENAVRYGVSKKRFGGTVTISTCPASEGIKIIVSDDGAGFDFANPEQQDGRSHIGIKNVRERLLARCGGTLTIESEKGKGTVCTVIIPRGGI